MVYAAGNTRKEKSRNLTNFLRIKKGLKKKKSFEFSTLVVGIDACTRDHECGGFGTTTTTTTTTTTGVVVCGLKKKKKRNIRDLMQNHSAKMCSEPDDDAWSVVQERALIQAMKELIPKGKDVILTNQRCWEQVATAVPGKKMTAIQCKNKFALLVKQGFSFSIEE